MHQVILDRLEEFLSGSPCSRDFTAHLESCEACRVEVQELKDLSGVMFSLRAPEALAPSPGFYARVSRRVEAQKPRALWRWVWLDPAFGKRVAFASLMTLVVLGSFLITRETEYSAGPPRPEAIMAQQAPGDNPDMILATLASYEP